MGCSTSKYELRKEKAVENICAGGLADVFEYRNAEEALNLIVHHTITNWGYSGTAATKDNLVNLCTAAVQGQGKTELCRQLSFRTEEIAERLNLQLVIPLHISFNQHTSFSPNEVGIEVDKSVIWRTLYAFGNFDTCYNFKKDLRSLLRKIRETNARNYSCSIDSVGILLMVDEVLKVKKADEVFFDQLLDLLTALQQRELRENLPTFLILTSLELITISERVVVGSGRKLEPIPMPFLKDLDLDIVAQTLFDQFANALCANQAQPPGDIFLVNLRLLIRIAVSLSGRHFRSLEEAMKALYKRLVSDEQNQYALVDPSIKIAKLFKPGSSTWGQNQLFEKRGGELIDVSVKEIFDTVVNQVEITNVTKDHYLRAQDLFLKLIEEPSSYVVEKELYDLMTLKIVFIKSRNLSRMGYIIPRVNLPFLFLYPRAEILPNCKLEGQRKTKPRSGDNPTYLQLSVPSLMKFHVEVLLGNIGVALTRPFSTLSRAFEEVMVYIELLTVAAQMTNIREIICLEDLIPNVVFKPWTNETLSVSSFVSRGSFEVKTPSPSSQNASPMQVVIDAIHFSANPNCNAVYIVQGDVNMERIEHVSRLFSVRDRQVVSLCSMKLREKTNPVTLARDMHVFAQRLQGNGCRLVEQEYYAVIYCCTPKDTIDVTQLPHGTVVVPFEAVRKLLYPFGLNKLLVVAEEKWQSSKV